MKLLRTTDPSSEGTPLEHMFLTPVLFYCSDRYQQVIGRCLTKLIEEVNEVVAVMAVIVYLSVGSLTA